MAEFLVRVHDKVNADPYLDCKCLKRGDVVVVVENGWQWSPRELSNPAWRIIKLPNVSVTAASILLGPELDVDPENPSRVLQRRKSRVNILHNGWPQAIRNWWTDDTRAEPFKSSNISEATFMNFVESKPALIDPNIIG